MEAPSRVHSVVLSLALTLMAGGHIAGAAPVLQQLYLEGVVLPGAASIPGNQPTDTVRTNGQRKVFASADGDFVGAVHTGPASSTYYLFGSIDGAAPTALRREGVVTGLTQDTYFFGAADAAGNIAYAGQVLNPAGGIPSRLSSLWENDTLVYKSRDAIGSGPLAGKFFETAGGLYKSPTGVTTWTANYTDSAGGAVVGGAILRDTSAFNALWKSGDAVGSLGNIAAESGAIGNINYSTLGTNFLTTFDLALGFTDTDEVMVLNGAPLTTSSGGFVREGSLIPVADGGLSDETWDPAGLQDVNEAGDWIVAAFSDRPTPGHDTADSIIFYNGSLLHREGQVVDGVTLLGQVQGVALNDLGDIVFAWNDTVFVNDRAIATVGTLVDRTGDGVGDVALSDLSLDTLEVTNLPAAGGDGLPVLYVNGDLAGVSAALRLIPAVQAPGDYNADGAIDAADYTTWRDTLGSRALLAADGDGSGVIDLADYTVWKNAFGQPALESVPAVPEPTPFLLLLLTAASTSTLYAPREWRKLLC